MWNSLLRDEECVSGMKIIFTFIATTILWGGGLVVWIISLGHISHAIRNRSILGGLLLANSSLGYVLLIVPSPTFATYVTYGFWPYYVGLVIGALL